MDSVVELITRVLCDVRPSGPVDGAYLYCTTADNQNSVIEAAGTLMRQGIARRTLIFEADAMSGYPGGARYREALMGIGVAADQIRGVPAGEITSINTLIEAEAMVSFVKERGFRDLVVVSPPFHQLRAFMTAVTVALKVYPDLLIYSWPGTTLPWMAAVTHSQGTLQAPRRQLIQEERVRIDTYQKKGDLARFEAVLAYLDNRGV